MCCFSGPVKSVSATNIFARMSESGRQFVIYSMTLNMAKPLAMVLSVLYTQIDAMGGDQS